MKISSQGNGVPETRIKQRVLDQCNKTFTYGLFCISLICVKQHKSAIFPMPLLLV